MKKLSTKIYVNYSDTGRAYFAEKSERGLHMGMGGELYEDSYKMTVPGMGSFIVDEAGYTKDTSLFTGCVCVEVCDKENF